MNNKERGFQGEKYALELLRKKNHQILTTNFRRSRGEIDIISLHGEKLVFTEVKTRHSDAFGSAVLSVNLRKQNQIIKVANSYIHDNHRNEEVQFDVVLLIINHNGISMHHIEDAFYPLV